MMYHPFKFGCKKTSSSVVMVETVIFNYMSPHCDHELEDSKPIFLHDTGPWWCIAIPNLVTDSSAVEDILSKWTFTGILNLSCDLGLDHNRAIQSFHKTIQLMLMYHQTKFICTRISSSEDRKSYFDYMIHHCDLDLEYSKSILLEDNLAHEDASPYQVWW